MLTEFFPFLEGITLSFVLKIPILIVLLLLLVFAFVLISRVRSMNRAVHVTSFNASRIVQFITIAFFFLVLSLFFITLAIL